MKRIFYILLMMVFFVLVSFFVYFCVLMILIRHNIVPLFYVDWFLGMMLSMDFYVAVGTL
jgi:hypothetical protein